MTIPSLNTGGVEQNPLHYFASKRQLYNPKEGPLRVAVGVSVSGSNFQKLLEAQMELKNDCPYKIVSVFADTNSGLENARLHLITTYENWGIRHGVKVIDARPSTLGARISEDERSNPEIVREKKLQYDMALIEELQDKDVNFLVLGGFMRLLTPNLTSRVFGINVHPAPLNVYDPITGNRKYVGDDAVRDQILAGESHLRSSVNIVRDGKDTGEILTISKPVTIHRQIGRTHYTTEQLENDQDKLARVIKDNQNRLKEQGDWEILPVALEAVARGMYSFNQRGELVLTRYAEGEILIDKPENIDIQDIINESHKRRIEAYLR